MIDSSSQQVIRVVTQNIPSGVRTMYALLRLIYQKLNEQPIERIPQGEQTPVQLNAQKRELDNIVIEDGSLADFKAELNRYGVDFAIIPREGTGGAEVLFKVQDTKQITSAFEAITKKRAVQLNGQEQSQPDLPEVAADLKSKLEHATPIAEQREAERAAQKAAEKSKEQTAENAIEQAAKAVVAKEMGIG